MASSLPIAAWRQTWLRIVSPSGDAWAVHPAELGKCEGIYPQDSPVHVISAWNPGSKKLSADENWHLHAQLLEELTASKAEIWEGTGSSRTEDWTEVGIARVGCSLDSSISIARRWEQDAIWEWHREGLAVVECNSGLRHEWGWILAALPSRKPFDDLEGLIAAS